MKTKPQEVAKSYATRPPLDELMEMDVDDVRPWWAFMSVRERRAWRSMKGRIFRKSTNLLSDTPVSSEVPPSAEAMKTAAVTSSREASDWIKKLEDHLRKMPSDLFICVSGTSAEVLVVSPSGECEVDFDTSTGRVLPGRWMSEVG